MSGCKVTVLLAVLCAHLVLARRNPFTHPLPEFATPSAPFDTESDAGKPVFVSKYLQKPEIARELTRVQLPDTVIEGEASPFSYSGFFTVNTTYNSNLFYWFFEAQNGDKNAPVILWLQGGPGGSSLFGLFSENGPYSVTDDLKLVPKNITWNSKYAMLYVDNPVGTGFSFTDSLAGYNTNEDEVATNLYNLLVQFFTVYSDYKTNDFYIAGESYAGKYVPALGYKVWQENKKSPQLHIQLRGLSIGDGLCDLETQVTQYANLAYYFGLADNLQQKVMLDYQEKIIKAIHAKKWLEANNLFTDLIDGPPDYFQNITGEPDYFDVRRTVEPSYGGNFVAFVNQSSIRKALHVGNHYFQNNNQVYLSLQEDIPQSVKPLLPTLIENYKVMFYNGQFDFIVGVALTETMIPTIRWKYIDQFMKTSRVIWKVHADDVSVAGYARQYKSLTEVVVRGAGHILPFDQPERAFDMIDRFIQNRPFTN